MRRSTNEIFVSVFCAPEAQRTKDKSFNEHNSQVVVRDAATLWQVKDADTAAASSAPNNIVNYSRQDM